MVDGRYSELTHGGYFMVYKPTFTSLGGPILYNHKVLTCKILNQPMKLAIFAYNVLQPWDL